MNSKVSIIVPIYNAESTIENCIKSLINQSYVNIEIILVDDGSTDDSLKICKKIAQNVNRITIIESLNQGVSNARNLGLKASSGEFVLFCDSDDLVSNYWVEIMMSNYQPNQLLMCKFKEFDNEANITSIDKSQFDSCIIQKRDFLFFRNVGIGSPTTKLFENEIIRNYNINFSKEISLGEDLLFVLEYLSHINGEIKLLDIPLYNYRVTNEESLSKKTPKKEETEFFYKSLKYYMQVLGATDKKSEQIFSNIILFDFEKLMIKFVNDSQMPFKLKLNSIKQIFNTTAYRECCKSGIISNNKFYQWIFSKRKLLLFVVFIKMKRRLL